MTCETSCCDSGQRTESRLTRNISGIDYYDIGNDNKVEIFLLPFETKPRIDSSQECVGAFSTRVEYTLWNRLKTKTLAQKKSVIACAPESGAEVIQASFLIDTIDARLAEESEFILELHSVSYELTLESGKSTTGQLTLDPQKRFLHISKNLGQVTDIDFLPKSEPLKPTLAEPKLNYLAKDYASFRKLILDRFASIMPDWQERNEADLGMVMVELLSYVGDQLSYQQDAVATEAYLETARRRQSVKRHTRLIDYRLHEGCNARTLLHIAASSPFSFERQDVFFSTQLQDPELQNQTTLRKNELEEEQLKQATLFEPMKTCEPDFLYKVDDILNWWPLVSQAGYYSSYVCNSIHQLKPLGALSEKFRTTIFKKLTEDRSADNRKLEFIRFLNLVLEEFDLTPILDYLISIADDHDANRIMRLEGIKQKNRRRTLGQANRRIADVIFENQISPISDDRHHFHPHLNEVQIYTWCQDEYWLKKGATSVDFVDQLPTNPGKPCGEPRRKSNGRLLNQLRVGDYLVFEEVLGPKTGNPADANPNHRQAVRVRSIRTSEDPVTRTRIAKVTWSKDDALQFPLCIATTTAAPSCKSLNNVSVARGNIVPIDHGYSVTKEFIGKVESDKKQVDCGSECAPPKTLYTSLKFRPKLGLSDLTFSQPIHDCDSAAALFTQKPHKSFPDVTLLQVPSTLDLEPILFDPDLLDDPDRLLNRVLTLKNVHPKGRLAIDELLSGKLVWELDALDAPVTVDNEHCVAAQKDAKEIALQLQDELREKMSWQAELDLFESGGQDRHFVVEMDEQRRCHLFFGDNINGQQPRGESKFYASYRVGNGVRGNVGAEAVKHIIFRRNSSDTILSIRNPFGADGGHDPEPVEQAKLKAPHVANRQDRAVIAEDYESLVQRFFAEEVQSSIATITQKADRFLVNLYIDSYGHLDKPERDDLMKRIHDKLVLYKRIGHDVEVQAGRTSAITLGLNVGLFPNAFRGDIKQELESVFGDRRVSSSELGYFHPDRVTFGQTFRVSQIVTRARKISGIENVEVSQLSTESFTNPGLQDLQLDNGEIPVFGSLQLNLTGGR